MKMTSDADLAHEAKALVALAFRNVPTGTLHAGRALALCSGTPEISQLTDEEMKRVMKPAVIALYRLLWLRRHDPSFCDGQLGLGRRYSLHWGDPELKRPMG